MVKPFYLICATVFAVLAATTSSGAQSPEPARDSALEAIAERGTVRCAVGETTPGFSSLKPDGTVEGFDVEFCRAIAAGLGEGVQPEFRPVFASEQFAVLDAGEVDLVSRHLPWTASTDGGRAITFSNPHYFESTGLAFTPAAEDVIGVEFETSTVDVPTGVVCVAAGGDRRQAETHLTLRDFADAPIPELGNAPTVLAFADFESTLDALDDRRCSALVGPRSVLAATTAATTNSAEGAGTLALSGELFDVQPLAIAMSEGGPALRRLVNGVIWVLVEAERRGISGVTAAEGAGVWTVADADREALETKLAGFGLTPADANRIVATTGNYGELHERTLGALNPTLGRGMNMPGEFGGLLGLGGP